MVNLPFPPFLLTHPENPSLLKLLMNDLPDAQKS